MKRFATHLLERSQPDQHRLRFLIAQGVLSRTLLEEAEIKFPEAPSATDAVLVLLQSKSLELSRKLQACANGIECLRLLDQKQNLLAVITAVASPIRETPPPFLTLAGQSQEIAP